MALLCDLCRKETSVIEHKIACEKCYNLLLYLLTEFEKTKGKKIVRKKAGKRKKREKSPILQKPKVSLEKKTVRQLRFEKSSKKINPIDLLTKCAVCEFGFLSEETKKISCTEEKDPKTCNQ